MIFDDTAMTPLLRMQRYVLHIGIAQTPGSGILGTIEIADVEITVINTASPRFSDNFTAADPPENVVVTIYQWFGGLQYSEKEILFRGVITGSIKYDEYTCTMTVRGIFEKYNKQIGADMIITPDAYPDADPDEYGKMSNIIYGDIETGGQKRHKRFLGNIKPAGAGLIGIAVYLYLTDRTLLISSQLTFPALLSRLRSM